MTGAHSQYVLATSVLISFKRISAGSLANGQLARRAHSSRAHAAARTRGGNSACVAGLQPRLVWEVRPGCLAGPARIYLPIGRGWPRLSIWRQNSRPEVAGRAVEGERPKLWAAVLHVGPRLSRSDEISHTCSATMRCAAILAAPGRGSAEPPCLAPCFGVQ